MAHAEEITAVMLGDGRMGASSSTHSSTHRYVVRQSDLISNARLTLHLDSERASATQHGDHHGHLWDGKICCDADLAGVRSIESKWQRCWNARNRIG